MHPARRNNYYGRPFFARPLYTRKMETTEQQQDDNSWPFAGCYAEKYGFLPPSQRREAVKRLTQRRRNPLTVEQCAEEESPEVEAVLAQVYAAYQRKKLRSKAASAAKRAPPREEEETKSQSQPQPQPLEPLEPDTVEPGFAELSIDEPEPEPQRDSVSPEPPAHERDSVSAPPQPKRDSVSPLQRSTSVRPQRDSVPPRRSMLQSPAPAPVQPPKKVAGGLRAALMRRGV